MKKTKKESNVTTEGFDEALAEALGLVGAKTPNKVGFGVGKLRQMLKDARSDPQGWSRRNRDDIRKAAERPRIAARLREEAPEYTEEEHTEFLKAFYAGPEAQATVVGAWDEERKAKWLKWIERVIPILKTIGALVPPPYNLIVFALVVVLTLIKENRLQPAELSTVMAEMPDSIP